MAIINPTRLGYEVPEDWYDFECEVPKCGFTSRGWHTEEAADGRGAEHMNEHVTGELMTELVAFEQSVGFVRSDTPVPAPVTIEVNGEPVTFDSGGNVVPSAPDDETPEE